jgi:hypothetical protein
MLTYSQARIHAIACGIDLSNADAVPLDKVISRSKSGKGAWPAIGLTKRKLKLCVLQVSIM